MCCNVDEIIEETLYVVSYAHKMFPSLPIYLKGHSLGGLVVLSCGLFHSEELINNNIKGIIAIAPYISSCPKIPITLYESVFIYLTSIFAPLMKLPTGKTTYPDDIPRQFADWILSHARAKDYITPRLLASCLQQISKVLPAAEKWPESIPLLFTQGMKDDMVDPYINLDWACRVLKVHPDKIEIHTYEKATHQITRCPYRGEQFRHIFNWISTLESK